MPLMSDAWHIPTYSWLMKTANRHEMVAIHDAIRRLEHSMRTRQPDNDALGQLGAQFLTLKEALTALSKAFDVEINNLRKELSARSDDIHDSVLKVAKDSADSAASVAAAVQALADANHGPKHMESDLKVAREQLSELRVEHTQLQGALAELQGASSRTSQEMRREIDALRTEFTAAKELQAAAITETQLMELLLPLREAGGTAAAELQTLRER